MSNKGIDSSKAIQIVRNFLAQYHAVLDVKDPILEDHTWLVDADVTSFGFNHIKRVRVNSETGKIMGYEISP
ncbi:MAG: hypothetical protein E6L00_02675 [Thaumarchaeota archaeon]|nr:MAG: hypothetical protein E6L00_02675 [Nitrososphaerota archaeon]